MQAAIANILKDKIAGLPFVDKLAGLVKTIETGSKAEDTAGAFRFPAAVESTAPTTPNAWTYADLVPNSSKKSVFYFEDRGLKVSGKSGKGFEMQSNLRLVGWLNSNYPPGSDALAVAHVLNALPEHPFNAPGYTRISVTPGAILGTEDNIFSKYTYDEKLRQYLMKPYSAFAIDLTINFTLTANCLPEYGAALPA